MYRQGDILIVPILTIPNDVQQIEYENGQAILAHGEATGHKHAFDKSEAILYANDNMYLKIIVTQGLLVHEEHSTIKIPAGNYKVIRQREYDDENEFRIVAD